MINIYEVVKKLVGEINPVGETNTDKKRLENLVVLTNLVDVLMEDIARVARRNKDRAEYSMSVAGKHAHNFFALNGIDNY